MKNLCLGTWQFEESFNKVTEVEAIELIKYAKKIGNINFFDTARVYGNGKVEQLLSQATNSNDHIITKIPAIKKPTENDFFPMQDFYTKENIHFHYQESKKALGKKPDTLLLHNWSSNWNGTKVAGEVLKVLNEIKIKEGLSAIGISLPNNYDGEINQWLLSQIDILEAPFNPKNKWILKYVDEIKKANVLIAIRSIFSTGDFFSNLNDVDNTLKLEARKVIANALTIGDILIIGMTRKENIDQNISFFEEALQ